MFTRLDDILYPNKVKVIHFHDKQKYIYPIFKNGSSSIDREMEQKSYKTLINGQITQLKDIDVFLRDPWERYKSGVQTFLHNQEYARFNGINTDSLLKLIEQGYILDRHYLPQICWLMNLMRYMSPEAKLHIHRIEMLSEYVSVWETSQKTNTDVPIHDYVNMALRLDNILFNERSGSGWTRDEIMSGLIESDPVAYATIFGKFFKGTIFKNVLS